MSYLVNDKNIAPIAYGKVSSNGTGSDLYNCTITGTNYYTINITTGTYTHIVPIYSVQNANGAASTVEITSNSVQYRTSYGDGSYSSAPMTVYFVIFGYN